MSRRFANLDPAHRPHDMRAILRWGVTDRLLGRRRIPPPGPGAPRVAADLAAIHAPNGPPRVTWIGHASFLVQAAGHNVLVDPVFSTHAGWLVPRHAPPGLGLHELPRIDTLLVTHAHYDHLDEASVRGLRRDVRVVVPLGLRRWFARRGFAQVHELGWWESARVDELRVTLVPARHWSRRGIGDTNRTLWGGFVIEADELRLYHAGDSAWFDGFAEVGRRFPGLRAALLPIGAYAPAWFMEQQHMNPEQAGRAFLATGARWMIPMHWGTFRLTDEPLGEPPERLRTWWEREAPRPGRALRVPAVGETIRLEE